MSQNLDSQPEITSLQQEVNDLRRFKQSFEIYEQLSKTFVSMMQRTSGLLLLRTMLRQTLETVVKHTGAEESSLFWLNDEGIVTDSILARGVLIREQKDSVVGQVLEKGLAGWVYRQQKIGLIEDTETDSRWVNLHYQPYIARSALCIPVIRGRSFLAIMTLTHSQPHHFSPQLVKTMEICADQIALILDQVRFYIQQNKESTPSEHYGSPVDSSTGLEDLAKVGVFILNQDIKFVYLNAAVAQIFGYTVADVVALGSFYHLIAKDDQEQFYSQIQKSFEQGSKVSLACKGVSASSAILPIEISAQKTKLGGQYVLIGTLRLRERQ